MRTIRTYIRCTVNPFPESKPILPIRIYGCGGFAKRSYCKLFSRVEHFLLTRHLPFEVSEVIRSWSQFHFFQLQSGRRQKRSYLKLLITKNARLGTRTSAKENCQMLELNRFKVKYALISTNNSGVFLNQQLRTIQEELGGNSPDREVSELRDAGRQEKNGAREVEEVFTKNAIVYPEWIRLLRNILF